MILKTSTSENFLMSTSRMNLEEIITSAKYRTYTKRLCGVVLLFLIIFLIFAIPMFFAKDYGSESKPLQVFLGFTFVLVIVAVTGCFIKWGDYIAEENLGRKIKDLNIGQLKEFYNSYGLAPLSHKKLDEKILIEQIMIDITYHFKNQGDFIEPMKDYEVKGIKKRSTAKVYSFMAMAEDIKLDDRVNQYILDTFFSTNFLDNVKLDSIKFRQ